jgi:transglutaminase-like putative cysteine protease
MLIRLGYDIRFDMPRDVAMVALLNIHSSRIQDLREPDVLRTEPAVPITSYIDGFGNLCTRFIAPRGPNRLYTSTLIEDDGLPDPVDTGAREVPVQDLPPETLQFLLSSRYCEVDLLNDTAARLFGGLPRGWSRVQTVCDWVHNHVTFGYPFARATRTALEVYNEGVGVCRDYQHLAVTFCRCLNIPARYATGYLGDIRVPVIPGPMDFSAWFEVYLEDRWWAFDARFNTPRIGRTLMATGRDAADVAITTSFGSAPLVSFEVVAEEVIEERGSEDQGADAAPGYSGDLMSTATSSL